MPINQNFLELLSEDGESVWHFPQNGSSLSFKMATPVKFRSLAIGYYHSIAIADDDTLWGWGGNDFGQAGLGKIRTSQIPVKSSDLPIFHSISCGGYFSLALDRSGKIWAFGDNEHGQLGLGLQATDLKQAYTPTMIESLSNISMIDSGYFHSVAIDLQGNVFAFGNDSAGQLGLGNKSTQQYDKRWCAPEKIDFSNAAMVACGHSLSYILDVSGALWGAGQIDGGNFIRIPDIGPLTHISCTAHSVFLRDANNQIFLLGLDIFEKDKNLSSPRVLDQLQDKSLILGGSYALVVNDGNIECYGSVCSTILPKQLCFRPMVNESRPRAMRSLTKRALH